MTQTVYFIGVRTEGSRIFALFPRWMEMLGIDARIEGIDLPLGAARGEYRDVVRRVAEDPEVIGAVITAHKVGVYAAAHDLFAAADRFVPLCREVSVLSKQAGALAGHAPDPLSARAAMTPMLGPDYWARHAADVLCLGAGGAATAITFSLLTDLDPPADALRAATVTPRRLLLVDVDSGRLDALRRMVEAVGPGASVRYFRHTAPEENDALLARLPPASLIINATGLGKDRPGSPLTDAAVFPADAAIWDLNYRGALPFLAQARAQQERRQLQVHDGRLYFLHGWTQSLSLILGVDLAELVVGDR